MRILSYLSPKTIWTFVYMLQQTEYNPAKFIKWAASFPNLFQVQKRGSLQLTLRVKLMLLIAYSTSLATLLGVGCLALWFNSPWVLLGILTTPFLCVVSLYATTLALQSVVINPKQAREIQAASKKLNSGNAQHIAVLGSYGKTSMKELLHTILSEGKKVEATPGNKNVLISHARWINTKVHGDEDILIFEYGEAAPGDIAKLASFSKPTHAVITGLAPAHLDYYASVEAIADDFATILQFTDAQNTYVNGTSKVLTQKLRGNFYTATGIDKWRVSNAHVSFEGTSFTITNGKRSLDLSSGLLGMHHIGPLTAAVVLALQLGLSEAEIKRGVAQTQPYEHRMQPRALHGAWIIDDTYNGTIEGMRAGLELLKILPGKRKLYITPGLVDQGAETEAVHKLLGALIAKSNPDQVVLMQNSVTPYIQAGLESEGYTGNVATEPDPLHYYKGLEHFLANGDVALLQNDWPDSYK